MLCIVEKSAFEKYPSFQLYGNHEVFLVNLRPVSIGLLGQSLYCMYTHAYKAIQHEVYAEKVLKTTLVNSLLLVEIFNKNKNELISPAQTKIGGTCLSLVNALLLLDT